jgi:hypothetical protein
MSCLAPGDGGQGSCPPSLFMVGWRGLYVADVPRIILCSWWGPEQGAYTTDGGNQVMVPAVRCCGYRLSGWLQATAELPAHIAA